jgi:protein-L-isoaspartate(D-aspartate) O-methyltransferase
MLISKNLKTGSSNFPRGESPFQREYTVARRKMVDELRSRGIQDERVLERMGKVPRHRFVEEALISQAYQDSPLNIGFGQTISQPYTVALLAQSLHLKGGESILEIGTGCGYQTAILAGLAKQIYSIERLHSLILKARANLKRLEVKNVILKYGDGSQGWKAYAPFDAIVAAAVSPQLPKPLLDQLAEGGRLVVPVEKEGKQQLVCVVKEGSHLREEIIEACRFVKMVGKHAFRDTSSKNQEMGSGREVYKPQGKHLKTVGTPKMIQRRRTPL